jgi:hypothetical protein
MLTRTADMTIGKISESGLVFGRRKQYGLSYQTITLVKLRGSIIQQVLHKNLVVFIEFIEIKVQLSQ